MLPQCEYVYPNGHRCGRIPGRGQRHCPAHNHPQATAPGPALASDPVFRMRMTEWASQCARMVFPDLLNTLGLTLCPIERYVNRHASRRTRVDFARAAVALSAFRDRLAAGPRSEPANPLTDDEYCDLMIHRLQTVTR